jgi:hypothetical protein
VLEARERSGGNQIRLTTLIVLGEGRRVSRSLCFGYAFYNIRKVIVIFGFLKQLLKKRLVWKI